MSPSMTVSSPSAVLLATRRSSDVPHVFLGVDTTPLGVYLLKHAQISALHTFFLISQHKHAT